MTAALALYQEARRCGAAHDIALQVAAIRGARELDDTTPVEVVRRQLERLVAAAKVTP